MDESMKRLLQRLMRRIPSQMLRATLEKWGRLTEKQLQSLDVTQTKWALTEQFLAISEEKELTTNHLTELEMIYVMDNPNQGMWYAFQLTDPEDDADSVELTQFKEQFKSHLRELLRHVSVKIKKHTDEAVWIRIAWGNTFSRPNHLKPTYAVHYLQTPYVFVTSMTAKQKPLFSQAVSMATRYQTLKDANLSGRKFTAIRDLLMRQYQQALALLDQRQLSKNLFACFCQTSLSKIEKKWVMNKPGKVCNDADLWKVFIKGSTFLRESPQGLDDLTVFPTKHPSPLAESNKTISNPHIVREQAGPAAKRLRMASEAFGGGMLPQLQSAVYKLETKFRDQTNKTMTEREEPFRCVVKFASTNLLESLRHCASSGIASTPVTPLLSSIPRKGRNYFVITDNGPGPSNTTRQPQN